MPDSVMLYSMVPDFYAGFKIVELEPTGFQLLVLELAKH